MSASRALGRAFLAAGGTMVFLGGAVVLVSGTTLSMVKAVVERKRSKVQVPCTVCHAKRRVSCQVCEGARIIKYWPKEDLPPAQAHTWSVCAMCEGDGDHNCINCVGTGTVYPDPWTLAPGSEVERVEARG